MAFSTANFQVVERSSRAASQVGRGFAVVAARLKQVGVK